MMKSFNLLSKQWLVFIACMASMRNVADAVDIRFHSVTCDQSLPMVPSFTKHCHPCVLGQSHEFAGIMVYNGVANLGIYEASLSSNITFDNTGGMATVDLIKDQKFQLCPDAYYMEAIYDTYCPADGSYAFDFNFTMPNSLGWYTTGFTGVGHLSITDDAGDLLGYCNINAEMYPTSQSVSASGIEGPSAKNILLLVMGVLALIALSYMCFGMCGREQRKRQDLYRPGYYREPESKLVRMLDCA